MAESKPKTPTHQAVSAVLRKAGFERSKTYTTGVKGWHDRTAGYVVHAHRDGEVSVHHEDGRFRPTESDLRRNAEQEALYATAIEEAGFAVERVPAAAYNRLIVRAKAEEDGQ